MSVVMMEQEKRRWNDDRHDDLTLWDDPEASRRLMRRMTLGICVTNVIGFSSVIVLIIVAL